jgi:prepilin-type N-terminal cleavage/methylation domain-containing protein
MKARKRQASRGGTSGRIRRGFVLLEVIVSVAILGIAVSTILRSFTLSLDASRRSEIYSTSVMLAENLLEEIQVTPPSEGEYKGEFGPDYPGYRFIVVREDEDLKYDSVRGYRDKKDLYPLRRVHLEIFYKNESRKMSMRTLNIESAVLGLQKFSDEALKEYDLFDLY